MRLRAVILLLLVLPPLAWAAPAPAKPTSLSPGETAEFGPVLATTAPTLSWSSVPGAATYSVAVRKYIGYWSTGLTKADGLVVDKGWLTEPKYEVPPHTLEPGASYRWNVRAYASDGTASEYSVRMHFRTPGVASAPLDLRATAGPDGIDLAWSPPASDGGSPVSSYAIHRATQPAQELPPYTTVPGSSTTFRDAGAGLAAGTTYYYFLTASNGAGESLPSSEVSARYAPPARQPPVAAFTATTRALAVDVDAAGSSDADGTIATYAWAWGDGTTGVGRTASHAYAAAGAYTVSLTVTDDHGLTGTASRTVHVSAPATPPPANAPPTAAFTVAASGLRVDVDARGSRDPDGVLVAYAWDWGDGTPAGAGVASSHAYAAEGTYTLRLTVTDNASATAATTQAVTLSAPPPQANQPPVAAFDLVIDGLHVAADATASTDAEGLIASYAWDWGDGAVGVGREAQHAYDAPGTFTLRLTVTDDDGNASSTSRVVTLARPAGVPPVACFTVVADGLVVQVDASCSTDADGAPAAWSWAWGDGSPPSAGRVAIHTYAEGGAKNITLTVTDDALQRSVLSRVVTVRAPLAATATANRTSGPAPLSVALAGHATGGTPPYAWAWTLGDAGTAATQDARAAFPEGRHLVVLTVTDAEGRVAASPGLWVVAAADDAETAPCAVRDYQEQPPGADRLLDYVSVKHEAGPAGYCAWNPREPAGARGHPTVSWGFIQFHQGASLGEVMRRMRAADAATFDRIFGPTGASTDWDRDDLRSLADEFARAARVPAFQRVQREVATESYYQAFVVDRLDEPPFDRMRSERSVALLLDARIQGCLVWRDVARQLTPDLTEREMQRVVVDVVQAHSPSCSASPRRAAILADPTLSDDARLSPDGRSWTTGNAALPPLDLTRLAPPVSVASSGEFPGPPSCEGGTRPIDQIMDATGLSPLSFVRWLARIGQVALRFILPLVLPVPHAC